MPLVVEQIGYSTYTYTNINKRNFFLSSPDAILLLSCFLIP